jgi:tetratricopeptide (TPR) repeat protein
MSRKKKGPESVPPAPDPQPEDESPKIKGKSRAKPAAQRLPSSSDPAKPKAKPQAKAKPKSPAKSSQAKPRTSVRKRNGSGPSPLESMLWDAFGGLTGRRSVENPQRLEAMALVERASDLSDPVAAAKLARQALAKWPDCGDAHMLLAELARGPKEALDHYSHAVESHARALYELTKDPFGEWDGHFWGMIETRPYMRARLALAQTMWALGRRDEAVEHYRQLLKLNPNDNQGVRYILAPALLEIGRDAELVTWLDRYKGDVSATWMYTAALLAFRRVGESEPAHSLIHAAVASNRFVPDLLTGKAMLPSRMPETVGFGDRDEAADYVARALPGWRATPGALGWVREATARPSSRGKEAAKKPAKTKTPTAASKTKVKKLARREGIIWQAAARKMPVWVGSPGRLRRPWVVLVASPDDQLILGQALLDEAPTASVLWDVLSRAMLRPAVGEPYRPERVALPPESPWVELTPHLEDVGVTVDDDMPLDLIDHLMDDLTEQVFSPSGGPALLEMPLVTPEKVAGFYQAAADFYRAAPWQKVTGDETIKIDCEQFESGPWYGVVIGQMGMTLGLALYEDFDALARMRDGDASDEENARETVALSITYGDETETPLLDVDAAEEYGWEVAAPDAYPAPMRKERGLVMRPPLAWELRLLEGCLRAIPEFVVSQDRDATAPGVFQVETADGPLQLALSWVGP